MNNRKLVLFRIMHNEPLGGVYLERYYLTVVMASDAVALSILLKEISCHKVSS